MFFLAALLLYSSVSGQVTIGMNGEPQKGALLDLKEKEISNAKEPNSEKGLLFPKVSLTSSTSLEPLFATTVEPQTITSTGMIVYNVNENAEGLKTGLCVWNGSEWTSVEGGGSYGSSIFDLNCESKITVKGILSKGKPLNPAQNTITFPVNVTKEGKYSIQAHSDNGYYFSSSGEFMRKGNYEVVLLGMGTPLNATKENEYNYLTFLVNDDTLNISNKCPNMEAPKLEVSDKTPEFWIVAIDASTVDLKKGKKGEGYVTARLWSSEAAAGAQYHIKSDTQAGIKFEGNGILTGGNQIVKLDYTGTPNKNGIFVFTFTSNSTHPDSREIVMEIAIKGKVINVAIFSTDDGGWNLFGKDRGVELLLNNELLFGPKSKFCTVEKIELDKRNDKNSETDFKDIDIVLLTYKTNPDNNMIAELAKFVDRGGILIHCFEGDSNAHSKLVNAIFQHEKVVRIDKDLGVGFLDLVTDSDTNPIDSIVRNGGYTDLSNKLLALDGGGNSSFYIPNTLRTDIDILAKNNGEAVIFKSKSKGYLVIGDGGIFNGGLKGYVSGDNDFRPLQVTEGYRNLPMVRDRSDVYIYDSHNASFFVNAMIWAVNRKLANE